MDVARVTRTEGAVRFRDQSQVHDCPLATSLRATAAPVPGLAKLNALVIPLRRAWPELADKNREPAR